MERSGSIINRDQALQRSGTPGRFLLTLLPAALQPQGGPSFSQSSQANDRDLRVHPAPPPVTAQACGGASRDLTRTGSLPHSMKRLENVTFRVSWFKPENREVSTEFYDFGAQEAVVLHGLAYSHPDKRTFFILNWHDLAFL